MFFRKKKPEPPPAKTLSQVSEQALRMFEKFMNMPPTERDQAVVEARNILENFRIVRAATDKTRKRSAQDDKAQAGKSGAQASAQGGGSEGGSSDTDTEECLFNALEEAVLFQELLQMHPELLGKLLEENNKKLRIILATVLQQRANTEQKNKPNRQQPLEQDVQRMAQELEKQMQLMRLQAACEVKEARVQKKAAGKEKAATALPARQKGLDAVLDQLLKPVLDHHEKTIAISRIAQAPPEALLLAETTNKQADKAQENAVAASQERESWLERS